MNEIKVTMDLLHQKKELFLSYEQTTNQMLDCDIEEMEIFFNRREELIEKIDAINAKIAQAAEQDTSSVLLQAIKNKCARNDLPEHLLCVFDLSQTVFSVINRISNIEPQIMARLMQSKTELENLIKSTNNTPKIAKYLNTVNPTYESGTFLKYGN